MGKDLTTSNVDRQNILNNQFAINEIYNEVGFAGLFYDGELLYTLKQVADYFMVDERTIARYLEGFNEELTNNGSLMMRSKTFKINQLYVMLQRKSATMVLHF